MKRKIIIKKGTALLLTLAMTAGMLPVAPGGIQNVQAALESENESIPDLSYFATKDQLMHSFDLDGVDDTVGKIVFGKNSAGEPQEWYIAGRDIDIEPGNNIHPTLGILFDNTVIFAADSMAQVQSFAPDENQITIDGISDTDERYSLIDSWRRYPRNVTVSTVNANHYGVSSLRVGMKALYDRCFSDAEKNLLFLTAVSTYDTENGVDYFTRDALYAVKGSVGEDKLLAGHSDDIEIDSSYWSDTNEKIGLRIPDENITASVLCVNSEHAVESVSVTEPLELRPASNLNLINVLFTSAAPVVSGDSATAGVIADGTAMRLRMKDSNSELTGASVKYDHGKITYTASPGTTLMVQGKGTKGNQEVNWYYAVPVTTDVIDAVCTAEQIETGAGLGYTPNLNNCKIWLEITDGDGLQRVLAGTDSKASVSAFASKEELITELKCDTTGNTGILQFGKNSEGIPQKWYIAGMDGGVEGRNTILVATSPIAKNQQFSDTTGTILLESLSESDYRYELINSCIYTETPVGGEFDSSRVTSVYGSHYGISKLRAVLKAMESDENYFSIGEQGLMNVTEVESTDRQFNYTAHYVCADKLYELDCWEGRRNANQYMVGTENAVSVKGYSHDSLFSLAASDNFWLRESNGRVYTGQKEYVSCTNELSVLPVTNLNLSDVLFSSAAKSASSSSAEYDIIPADSAMTLRLDGSDKISGSAAYNESDGKIVAWMVRGSKPASLVVQGKDGTNDWYYTLPFTGTGVGTLELTTAEIQSALGLSSFSLADCDIWMEYTDSTDGMTYAKMAHPGTVDTINQLDIAGINLIGGNTLPAATVCNNYRDGIVNTFQRISYTTKEDGNNVAVTDTVAEWNKTYTAKIKLNSVLSDTKIYIFADTVRVTVDGEFLGNFESENGDLLYVTQNLTTKKRKVTGINAPSIPTDNTFSAYYSDTGLLVDGGNSELGNQAEVTLEGTSNVQPLVAGMDVVWSLDNVGGADYNATPGAENTFRWTVPASEYGEYDSTSNNIAMTGTVNIKNKAAIPVEITGTDAGIAYTGSDIDVSDYFQIDSHAGTPVYSLVTGENGGTGEGTINGQKLTVTKTGTFVIKVETAANGNYGEGEKTITLTVGNGTMEYEASDYSGTYDGLSHGIQVEVSKPEENATISYSTDGTNYSSESPKFTDEGEYSVAYKIEADNYGTILGEKTVTITRKDISITAENQEIPWGTDLDSGRYIVSEDGMVSGDSISEIILTKSTDRITDNGTISVDGVKIINADGKDVTGNYDLSYRNGTLKVIHNTTLVPDHITAVKTKTEYMAEDSLDVDDIVVTAYYEDGYSETVTDYTTNVSDIDMSVAGEKTLTITYSKNGGERTADIVIAVTSLPMEEPPAANPKEYRILEGADGIYTLKTDGSYILRANGEFSKFAGVKVDGKTVDDTNYSAWSGSTYIEFKKEFMEGLTPGIHRFVILFTDGMAVTEITVKEGKSETAELTPSIPDTGDAAPIGRWSVMMILCALTMIIIRHTASKKKRYKSLY